MRSRRHAVVLDFVTIGIVAVLLLPMLSVVLASVQIEPDIVSGRLWPLRLTLAHYEKLLRSPGFLVALRNSLLVGATVAVVTCALAVPAAYAIARFRFRGRSTVSALILGTQMLPSLAVLVPLVVIMRDIGLTDTLAGLAFVYLALGLPIAVWMLRGFIEELPRELEEAAMIDGCNRSSVLRYIVMPLISPAIVAVGTFAFVLAWGEYLMALALITKAETRTLPLALQGLFDPYSLDWGEIMAGGVVIAAPAIVLFLCVRHRIVGGLMAGGVKG